MTETLAPYLFAGLVVLAILAAALAIALLLDVLQHLRAANLPQCCICGQRVSRSQARKDRWVVVSSYPVQWCRNPEPYWHERRRFTPPWLCGDCAADGWSSADLLLPEDRRP